MTVFKPWEQPQIEEVKKKISKILPPIPQPPTPQETQEAWGNVLTETPEYALPFAPKVDIKQLGKAIYGSASALMSQPGLEFIQPLSILPKATQATKGWTYPLQKVIEEKMPNRAPVEQVKSLIGSAGVKADEVKWSGLEDFLTGKQKVEKGELLKHLGENRIQLNEVIKSSGLDSNELAELEQLSSKWYAKTETPMEALRRNQLMNKKHESSTKFSKWQLPGGENYREMLLQLPEKRTFPDVKVKWTSEGAFVQRADDRTWRVPKELLDKSDADILDWWNSAYGHPELRGTQYKSAHWDEPNVLAHIRYNDRIDAQGKKVLFLEEVQSDWHQAGREKGYGFSEAQLKEWQSLFEKQRTLGPEAMTPDERVRLQELGRTKQGPVPPAPFSKTWHEMAMRRMVREAAEKGYDRVAWTTGEQQAARYDLSKQVKHIAWEKNDDGTYNLNAPLPNGQPGIYKEDLPLKDLKELVGKDITDKILKDEGRLDKASPYRDWRILEGENLKVGGEGMKGFYDKIIPEYMNKFGKKWGVKVTEINIPTEVKGNVYQDASSGRWFVERNGLMDTAHTYKTEAEALKQISGVPVHSFDITPAMRESIMKEGVPMFQVLPFSIPRKKEEKNKSVLPMGVR